jgi:8-oxo-dGTP pyrophosphatase MutT (NUDIX family)
VSDGTIRRISGKTVYRNAWMTVREDIVERPDGSHGVYGVVDKPDYALIVPAEADGFHLVQQYRYPVGGRFWEFPQGSWTDPGTGGNPEELAAAELREETGLTAGKMIPIGRVHVAYGYASQGCHIYLATELTAGPPAREPSEADLLHRFVTRAELRTLIADGSFADAASLAALTLLDGSQA